MSTEEKFIAGSGNVFAAYIYTGPIPENILINL